MENALDILLLSFSAGVILYFVSMTLAHFGLFFVSFAAIEDYMRRNEDLDVRPAVQSEFATPISVIAPAFNEGPTIVANVHSLLRLEYSRFEVIVVNDGSTDKTLELLTEEFSLRKSKRLYVPALSTRKVRGIYVSTRPEWSDLIVVDKENGGKADALNAGINVSRNPLYCAIDADSVLERDALLKVAKPFLEDHRVVAAGGIVRVANDCVVERGRLKQARVPRGNLPVFQIVEYLRAFLTGRMGWSRLNCLLIISGAFGLFRKNVVVACGGYSTRTVGEDMELVVRMHRYLLERKRNYRMVFVPDPVCWTEAPSSLRVLGRQRNRWQRGLMETLLRHRDMVLEPRYGRIGLLAMPYFVLYELLAPVVEFIGFLLIPVITILGRLNLEMLLTLFLVSLVYGVLLSLGAVLLEEISFHRYPSPRDLWRLMIFAVLENFGYRQLSVWWRIKGMIDHLRGVKSWGAMQRVGFTS
jgi:cellulose synthase/poly-beta-1,6-N-acetylglucosamine synthase-like glycosyltransferase